MQLLQWKNCISFYRMSNFLMIITFRYQSMALLVVYWCHFQSMGRCFQGRWTCPLVSENHHLEWRCLLFFLLKHVLRFVCIHVEANATCCLLQTMQQGFGLGRCSCKNHYVIYEVSVHNSFCRFLFFFFVNPFSFIRSIDVRSTQSRHFMNRYGTNVSSCKTPATMSKMSVTPSGEPTFTFVILMNIIMVVTVSLGRP